jgi:Mn2+/Fe2+ NRAMP family transporter
VRILKWLTLTLFAYVAVVLAVRVPWQRAIVESAQPWAFLPASASARDYAAMVVAVLGTTISPYLFFWQATQEVEDGRRRPETHALRHHKAYASEHLSRIKQDTVVGMGVSNVVALCIVVATAVTLNERGVTAIQTSAQAAEALRPVAGEFAFLVFGLGIVGTGLLAVPVLAGSAAYAVSELFGWKAGLSRGFHEARGFYLQLQDATQLLDEIALDKQTKLALVALDGTAIGDVPPALVKAAPADEESAEIRVDGQLYQVQSLPMNGLAGQGTIAHVVMVAIHPKTIVQMITGGPRETP